MSIEPVAWMNDDFEFFTNKDRAYPFGKCKPLYPQSAIDELQRQLAEREAAMLEALEIISLAN